MMRWSKETKVTESDCSSARCARCAKGIGKTGNGSHQSEELVGT